MPSMNDVIFELKNGHIGAAISQMLHHTGMTYQQSQKAVEALRPYLDPSYSKTAEASPEPTLAIPEGSPEEWYSDPEGTERKAMSEPQNEWIVTAISREGGNWFNSFNSHQDAVDIINELHNEGYHSIKLSKIYIEPTKAKPEINKWIITAYQPESNTSSSNRDWWDWAINEQYAIQMAKSLLESGFTDVKVSRVIAEAKSEKVTTTTWSIDL